MKLESELFAIDFDPYTVRTNADLTPTHGLGTTVRTGDFRTFRYGKAGASNISAGKLQTAPAQKTNHHSNTAIASTAGTINPTFTIGATAVVANEYAEGYLVVNVTPDVARTYKISSLGAVTSSGTANPTLFDPIQTSWTTSTRVSLVHNAFAGLIEGTVQTRRVAGVPLTALSATNFGWVQTKGVCGVLSDGAIALGSRIVPSGSVSGAVAAESSTFGTAQVTVFIGQASVMATADTEYRPIMLGIE